MTSDSISAHFSSSFPDLEKNHEALNQMEVPLTSVEDRPAKPCQTLTSQKDEVTPGHVLGEEVPTCRTERQHSRGRPGVPTGQASPSAWLTFQHEGLHEDPDPVDCHHQVCKRQAHDRQKKHRGAEESTGHTHRPWLISGQTGSEAASRSHANGHPSA